MLRARILAIATGAVLVVGCLPDKELWGAGHAVLDPLRTGNPAAAYEQLSSKRRSAMTLEQFTTLTDHVAFTDNRTASFYRAEQYHPGYCILGTLAMPEGEWKIQMFLLEEQATYRVHSLAIQQPAPVQLGTLLSECGYWSGTLQGYQGPPIELTTPEL